MSVPVSIRVISAVVLLTVAGASSADARPPTVAVMTVTDATHSLAPPLIEALTDALRARLAERGSFVVVDASSQAKALKQVIREQKRASYKNCYDSSCQIPLGQALAADSILRCKLTRIGSSYVLNAELVDLKQEAVTRAAQASVYAQPARSRDDRLLRAVQHVATRLSYAGSPASRTVYTRPPRAAPQQTIAQRRALIEQRQREREARSAQSRAETTNRRRRVTRITRLLYGWSAIGGAGLAGILGVYYMTAKVSDESARADAATTPGELDRAADAARSARRSGAVFLAIAGLSAGLGAYLLWTAPAAPETAQTQPTKTALDRLPRVAPLPSGAMVGWGGTF